MEKFSKLSKDKPIAIFVDSKITTYAPTNLPSQKEFAEMLISTLYNKVPSSLQRIPIKLSLKTISRIIYEEVGSVYFEVLKCFHNADINQIHVKVAKMLVKGKIRVIINTGMDNCLELALENEGLKKNVDFLVLTNDDELDCWPFKHDKPVIIKLRGEFTNPKCIQESLEMYNEGMGKHKVNLISYILMNYYSIILGIDTVFPYLHHYILETYPCGCPGITFVGDDEKIIEDINNAIKLYEREINIINSKESDFLEELCKKFGLYFPKKRLVDQKIQHLEKLEEWEKKLTPFLSCKVLASIFSKIGEDNLAFKYRKESLEIATQEDNKLHVAEILISIALENYYSKRDDSLKKYEKAIGILEELGQRDKIVKAYLSIGEVCLDQHHFNLALNYFKSALDIYMSEKSKVNIAWVYSKLGKVYEDQKDFKDALDYYNKSLQYYEELDVVAKIGKAYNNIARVHFHEDMDKAKMYYFKAQEYAWESGDIETIARIYSNLAVIAHKKDDMVRAQRLYWRSGVILGRIGKCREAAAVYYNLALLKKSCNQMLKAKKYVNRGLKLYQNEIKDKNYFKLTGFLSQINNGGIKT